MGTTVSVPHSTLCLALALAAGLAQHSLAAPRQPLPPWPEWHLRDWRFDEALTNYPNEQLPAVIEAADLVESWSGYALRRQGDQAAPFVISEHETTNRVNFAVGTGTIRFWFRPNWGSPSEGGSGPGNYARLIELIALDGGTPNVWWSLYVNPEGTALHCSGRGPTGPADYLTTDLHWPTATWHLVTLTYSTTNSALYIDQDLLATGTALPLPPTPLSLNLGLVLGSEWTGTGLAQGQFDELTSFDRVCGAWERDIYYSSAATWAALGPISPEEIALRQETLQQLANRSTTLPGLGGKGFGNISPNTMIIGGISPCITNVPVFITNVVSSYTSNQGWTVTFDIRGGTNGLMYDIFSTTNLKGDNLTNATWTYLEQGPTCSTYQYTNQPEAGSFYILGTPQDNDHDKLTDAFELLVTKSNPNNPNTDNDDLNDYEEWLLGRNPNVSNSIPDAAGLIGFEVYTPMH